LFPKTVGRQQQWAQRVHPDFDRGYSLWQRDAGESYRYHPDDRDTWYTDNYPDWLDVREYPDDQRLSGQTCNRDKPQLENQLVDDNGDIQA
jgi:hypothetical protein